KDHGLPGDLLAVEVLLHALLQVQEAPQHLEPGIRLEQLVPQIAGRVLAVVRWWRVTGATIQTAQVEWQEEGVLAVQLGGHRDLALPNSEMHQRAALEAQQRLRFTGQRVFYRAVITVLTLGVFHALLKLAFQLQRGSGDAVDEQHQIQTRVVALATATSLAGIR